MAKDEKANGGNDKGKSQQKQNRRPRRQPRDESEGNRKETSKKSTNKRNNRATTPASNKSSRGRNEQKNTVDSKESYRPYLTEAECTELYHANHDDDNNTTKNTRLVRGTIRVLPGDDRTSKAFVSCDRGLIAKDVLVDGYVHRNRALHGDVVYVELFPAESDVEDGKLTVDEYALSKQLDNVAVKDCIDGDNGDAGDVIVEGWQETEGQTITWQDDAIQMDLWNPLVTIARETTLPTSTANLAEADEESTSSEQRKGQVVHVVRPKCIQSELDPTRDAVPSGRRIVGSIMVLQGGTILLTPSNRSLPQFKCPQQATMALIKDIREAETDPNGSDILRTTLFSAEYVYGSWKETHKNWAPCRKVKVLGKSCILENEIQALLMTYQVDHGDFSSSVLKDVHDVVRSGVYQNGTELGWKPTEEMYKGRRDYRKQRIFTIDPTTAKDLDDALHITQLPDGSVEVGVHIADVSFFVRPETAVDEEALNRATTVYLVDRTVPMLPRPLCEVACSLNENVERLAFSCVWRMNADGNLRRRKKEKGDEFEDDVWYGRTVIKSCARLDYNTAQNIIDNKDVDEETWPLSRRPTGGHTLEQVSADVRLMHRVAMARRRLRFDNGALSLTSVKLTFRLDSDGQTPLLAAPYPIRDSNRLIEEYMLIANYLVAQRLITHSGDRACLRYHPPPNADALEDVAATAKAGFGFDLNITSSEALQASLSEFSRIHTDPIEKMCMLNLMILPMQQAQYFAAGTKERHEWRHFALNIPYYTHFTSPIRRYPDVIVHRLLQSTIDETIDDSPQDMMQIEKVCRHSSGRQKDSKEAQQRCDRVFLSLYVKSHPMRSELGIVMSVGNSAFTAFVPSLGADALLYLEEHRDMLTWATNESKDKNDRIVLKQKANRPGKQWHSLDIKVFTKVLVTVICGDRIPIDIKLRFEGPYEN